MDWLLIVVIAGIVIVAFALVIPVGSAMFWVISTVEESAFYQRRLRNRLREGQEHVHWPMHDMRVDVLVVDLSRIDRDEVGVRTRWYDVRSESPTPDYGEIT